MTESSGNVSTPDIRGELQDLIVMDLLGPKGGEREEFFESPKRRGSVRDRYLVGMLAPKQQQLTPGSDSGFENGPEPKSSDDGKADQVKPPADTLVPASFGMTFVVDESVTELEIEARWGRYLPAKSETEEDDEGKPVNVWLREPRGGPRRVKLAEGLMPPVSPDPDDELGDVHVRGIVRPGSGERIVTLFLVNGQEVAKDETLKDRFWLFQAQLLVRSPDGRPIFRRRDRHPAPGGADDEMRREERELAMLYRHEQEFAVGHGIGVDWTIDRKDGWMATEVRTVAIPTYEVRQQTPPTVGDEGYEGLAGVELRMDRLAEAGQVDLPGLLMPLVDAYDAWIARQAQLPSQSNERLHDFTGEVAEALGACRRASERIRRGIDLLGRDDKAAAAFKFANRAMWQQRIHSIYALGSRRDPDGHPSLEAIDADPRNKSWRPFQLAFILLNLESLTDLHHPDRSDPSQAIADLLWFPTGGGKTEAYLGLAAYTMGLRRLQGEIGGMPGHSGVTVLMRYTLRLLTLQQFQRATALLCAMEMIRRESLAAGDERWGSDEHPFTIGLWVGYKTTPNWTAASEKAVTELRQSGGSSSGGFGSPYQLTNCPWCGSRIRPTNLEVESVGGGRGRTFVYCNEPDCPFCKRQAAEGLPILVVDEEIYRRVPF